MPQHRQISGGLTAGPEPPIGMAFVGPRPELPAQVYTCSLFVALLFAAACAAGLLGSYGLRYAAFSFSSVYVALLFARASIA